MNLSDHRDLRAYRDELARSIAKRGGSYTAALEKANVTAMRIYRAAITGTGKPRGKLTDRAVCEAVAGTVAGVRRIAGVTEMTPARQRPEKRKDAAISEAVRTAVAKAVTEAVNGARAPARNPAAVPAAPAAPTAVELRAMGTDDFLDHLSGALLGEAVAPRRDAGTVSEALPVVVRAAVSDGLMTQEQAAAALAERGIVTSDNAPSAEDLRGMADDEFLGHFGDSVAGQAGLVSPFWRGAAAVRSPFFAGLADG